MPLDSSKSIHEPCSGIIRAVYVIGLPATLASLVVANTTPWARCIWDTITRSTPDAIKLPRSVINGTSPINISCSLMSRRVFLPSSATSHKINLSFNLNLLEYVILRNMHSFTLYTGSSNVYSTNSRSAMPA